jgi:hypothetical protein
MKPSEFVGMLFLARDVTHSVHLNTRSYAKHKALQKFYGEIVDLADSFAESYQGKHGLIGPISLMNANKTSNVIEFLQDQVETIEKARYEVCKESETSLQNIIDEIVGLYFSTLYKLRFLA